MRALVLLSSILLAASPLFAEDNVKTFPAQDLTSLHVEVGAGGVHVTASGTSAVEARVTDWDADKCTLTEEVQGKTLLLKLDAKRHWIFSADCRAGLRVTAPAALPLAVNAGSGGVRVVGMTGALTARLGSGGLHGEDVSGPVNVKVGSGGVQLSGLRDTASVMAGSGSVRLSWAAAPKRGSIDVKLGSGGARLVFPKGTRLASTIVNGSGSVENAVTEDPAAPLKLSVISGSGGVRVGYEEAARP
ncbi:MAG: hypothetical protein KGL53_08550 [Elusimicrobia bacterium]|nr:hypothetical protein [Elusimicrobiota bacterium]